MINIKNVSRVNLISFRRAMRAHRFLQKGVFLTRPQRCKNAKISLSSSTKKTQYGAPPFAPDETPVVLKIICIFNTNLGSPPPARGGQPFVTHPWVKGDVRDRRARTLTVARRTLAYRTHARASARASANRSGAREKEAACLCSFASAFFLRAAS